MPSRLKEGLLTKPDSQDGFLDEGLLKKHCFGLQVEFQAEWARPFCSSTQGTLWGNSKVNLCADVGNFGNKCLQEHPPRPLGYPWYPTNHTIIFKESPSPSRTRGEEILDSEPYTRNLELPNPKYNPET